VPAALAGIADASIETSAPTVRTVHVRLIVSSRVCVDLDRPEGPIAPYGGTTTRGGTRFGSMWRAGRFPLRGPALCVDDGEDGALRVGQDGEAADVRDVHRLHLDSSARFARGRRDGVRIGDLEVRHPEGRHALLRRHHAAGNLLLAPL